MIFVHDTPTNRLLNMVLGGGSPVAEYTATGNPLTFTTDIAKPLKSLSIPFTPQQEGTGDPSPTNIRPLLPWNGLTVWQGGGNLIDKTQLQDNYVWWNGSKVGGYNANCITPLIPVKEGATYYRQGRTSSQNAISFFDKDKAFLSQSVIQPPVSFTVPNGACYAGFTFSKEYKNEAMVNAGSSALPYEEYHPITSTAIAFPSPVYGGEHEAVSGKLMDGWAVKVFDGSPDELWDKISSGSASAFAMQIQISGKSTSADSYICDSLKNIARNATWGNYDNWISDNQNSIVTGIKAITTVEDWRAYLAEHPITVVYKLATPQEIQLTQAQITALVGDNTIWSDADGQLTAVYFKKG